MKSQLLPYVTRPGWLATWLAAGWAGGMAAVHVHYPEYRGHWPDWLVMAWARGVIPISLLLLSLQFSWRVLQRDAVALVVGLPLGAAAYAGYNWFGTHVLPFWMSDSMVVLWAGVIAGCLPVGSLWNAHCLRTSQTA